MAIEKATYKVILKDGPFEIRNYETMIIAPFILAFLKGMNY